MGSFLMAPLEGKTERRKRGRPSIAETYRGPRIYAGCARPVRVRDNKALPCGCKSCVEGGW